MATGPKLYINKSYVYGIDGTTKTKNSKRYIDCLGFVVEALEEQRKFSGRHRHIFLTKGEARMNPDHYRNVIWTRALDKAGLEYRPPIQTRHSFATMMLSAGEDVGWVQNMLGHSSLQMIFTRYYAWVPRKTRNDGAAFLASVGQNADQEKEGTEANPSAKVIELFPKATQKRHTPIKKGHGEKP
jgi:integrase